MLQSFHRWRAARKTLNQLLPPPPRALLTVVELLATLEFGILLILFRILPAMNFTPALLVPGAALDTKAHRAALELLPTVVPCHDGSVRCPFDLDHDQ